MLTPPCVHYNSKMDCGVCWCPECILIPNRPCVSKSTIIRHGSYRTPPLNWGIEFNALIHEPSPADDPDSPEELPFEVDQAAPSAPAQPAQNEVIPEQDIRLRFFRRLVYEVGQNGMKKKDAITLCKINAEVLDTVFPHGFDFPTTWEGIEKLAYMPNPDYNSYDICTNGGCGTLIIVMLNILIENNKLYFNLVSFLTIFI